MTHKTIKCSVCGRLARDYLRFHDRSQGVICIKCSKNPANHSLMYNN